MKLNVAFFAYRSWAFDLLAKLGQSGNGWAISGVYCPEQCEAGAPENAVTINPKELGALAKKLKSDQVKVLLFYGWSWIVPKALTDNFKCICLHPSPLPRYRGGSPIQNQIVAGEKESAVSLFFMSEGLDDGDVIEQRTFPLDGDLNEILARMSRTGAELSKQMLDRFASGDYSARKQDESQATTFKRRKPADSELKPDDFKRLTARQVHDVVRALQDPYPNAFIVCADGKKVFLTRTRVEE